MSAAMLGREQGRSKEDKEGGGGGGGGGWLVSDLPTKFQSLINIFSSNILPAYGNDLPIKPLFGRKDILVVNVIRLCFAFDLV